MVFAATLSYGNLLGLFGLLYALLGLQLVSGILLWRILIRQRAERQAAAELAGAVAAAREAAAAEAEAHRKGQRSLAKSSGAELLRIRQQLESLSEQASQMVVQLSAIGHWTNQMDGVLPLLERGSAQMTGAVRTLSKGLGRIEELELYLLPDETPQHWLDLARQSSEETARELVELGLRRHPGSQPLLELLFELGLEARQEAADPLVRREITARLAAHLDRFVRRCPVVDIPVAKSLRRHLATEPAVLQTIAEHHPAGAAGPDGPSGTTE